MVERATHACLQDSASHAREDLDAASPDRSDGSSSLSVSAASWQGSQQIDEATLENILSADTGKHD